MPGFRKIFLILAALWLAGGSAVLRGGNDDETKDEKPDPWLTGSVTAEVLSRYIQAGSDTGKGGPVFSDGFELDACDFGFGLVNTDSLTKDYNEEDAYLEYTKEFSTFVASAGYLYAYLPHGIDRSLHELNASLTVPFAKYYKAELTGEADISREIGTFEELVLTADYPVIKDRLTFSPYAAFGLNSGVTTGSKEELNGGELRFGVNIPFKFNERWELSFQVEADFSRELKGVVWAGSRVTYNF